MIMVQNLKWQVPRTVDVAVRVSAEYLELFRKHGHDRSPKIQIFEERTLIRSTKSRIHVS